ncbi:MAG: hypothetical protein P4N41_16855 [Negativicutes bacterium]|nr:hypothetical protein [Negativicutes bacterium]
MIAQKFALIIVDPHGKELGTEDVRSWLDEATGKVAPDREVVIDTFGDYSYGRIFKGTVALRDAKEISAAELRRCLEIEADLKFQFHDIQKL